LDFLSDTNSGRQLSHFLHHTPKLGILVPVKKGRISFKTFIETENLCYGPGFSSIPICYNISYLQVEESSIIGAFSEATVRVAWCRVVAQSTLPRWL